jgi:hypothetical protein
VSTRASKVALAPQRCHRYSDQKPDNTRRGDQCYSFMTPHEHRPSNDAEYVQG